MCASCAEALRSAPVGFDLRPEVHREEAGVSRDSPAEAPPVTSEEARGKLGKGKLEFPDEPLFRDGADEKPAKFKRDKNLQ